MLAKSTASKMIKQLVVLLFVAGVVLCNETQPPQEVAPAAAGAPGAISERPKGGLGKGLLDLAIIGSKNVKRTIDESRPTFHSIKKSLGKKLSSLRKNPALKKPVDDIANNPNVQRALDSSKKQLEAIANNPEVRKAVERTRKQIETIGSKIVANPHVQAAAAKAQPVIEQGVSKVNELISEADKKGRELTKKVLAQHEARQAELRKAHQEKGTQLEAQAQAQEEQPVAKEEEEEVLENSALQADKQH